MATKVDRQRGPTFFLHFSRSLRFGVNIILFSTSKNKGHKGPGNGGIGDVDVLKLPEDLLIGMLLQ